MFAAASLKNALDDINAQWQKETGKSAKISYAASSALAKQIESGAPAQLFISADTAWMDYVEKKDLIKKETRSDLLGNRIVLVAPKDKAKAVDIKPGFDLAKVKPDSSVLQGELPRGLSARALVEPGRAYAVYVRPLERKTGDPPPGELESLTLDLPAGNYRAEWLSPGSGETLNGESFAHSGGPRKLAAPKFAPDVALRVVRAD